MLEAKVQRIAAIYLECPKCGEATEDLSGSLLFTPEDYNGELRDRNGERTCFNCGYVFKLPDNPFG